MLISAKLTTSCLAVETHMGTTYQILIDCDPKFCSETKTDCARENVCEDTQFGTECCEDGEYCYRSSVRQYNECLPYDGM